MSLPTGGWDAVVLAGGRAARLGGIDKTALGPAGNTLLERAVRATAAAHRRVVVGPRRAGLAGVLWTREEPPFGGPVAGLAAALAALADEPAPFVAVVAADQPEVETALAAVLAAVTAAATATDAWVAVDPDGVRQPLLAMHRAAPLTAAVAALPGRGSGLPMRRVLAGLRVADVALPAALCTDVDTPADAVRHGLPLP